MRTVETLQREPLNFRMTGKRGLNQGIFLTIKYGMINGQATLDRTSKMEPNWDSYGAEAPSADSIKASKAILAKLSKELVLPSAIVASAGGGISIYFIVGSRTAYVETYNDGSQALVMYDKDGNSEILEIGSEIPKSEVGRRIRQHLD